MKTEGPQGLISIERVVAFVVGPLLAIGFGWAGSWLAQNVPGAPAIPAEAAVYVGGAISLGVAGLVYKWLHGRQVMLWAPVTQIEHTLSSTRGMETTVTSTAEHLVQAGQTAIAKALGQPDPNAGANAGKPPPEAAIPAAEHDPAPASAGQVADAGAATGS